MVALNIPVEPAGTNSSMGGSSSEVLAQKVESRIWRMVRLSKATAMCANDAVNNGTEHRSVG